MTYVDGEVIVNPPTILASRRHGFESGGAILPFIPIGTLTMYYDYVL